MGSGRGGRGEGGVLRGRGKEGPRGNLALLLMLKFCRKCALRALHTEVEMPCGCSSCCHHAALIPFLPPSSRQPCLTIPLSLFLLPPFLFLTLLQFSAPPSNPYSSSLSGCSVSSRCAPYISLSLDYCCVGSKNKQEQKYRSLTPESFVLIC